ncbi:LAQU0S03e09758g1_1 [Lachancea quebecensis]|uniref:LAQU0S03e09758g1_1 n=1 Tax=Lachancea quebecensis TaxID=1654605 RepID=A0A0P1KXI8_9SACH|nr:LAQU0S03e09758g1_1 [Lachancea quebecensis]
MSSIMKIYRSLTPNEKTILCETATGVKNGVLFSATYYKNSSNKSFNDNETLRSNKNQRLSDSVIWKALLKVIKEHAELRCAITTNLEFEPVDKIDFEDVVRKVEFDCYADEQVNCYNGVPPYLLRHIFDKCHFTLGQKQPLWQLFVIDGTMVVFHGHDVLFDAFAAANFHKLFLQALNSLSESCSSPRLAFKNGKILPTLPRSLFQKQEFPTASSVTEAFYSQSQAILRSLYNLAIKKPLRFIESGRLEHSTEQRSDKSGPMSYPVQLCGTVVFGTISTPRFKKLKGILDDQKISMNTFIISATLFCLQPVLNSSENKITFCLPINLRGLIPWSSPLGIYHRNILIECPLGTTSRSNKGSAGSYISNPELLEGMTLSDADLTNTDQSDPESIFERTATHVSNELRTALQELETGKFSDMDLVKMEQEARFHAAASGSKVVEINDLSEINLSSVKSSQYVVEDICATKSRCNNTFMSISYSFSSACGLNLGIHYSEDCEMNYFVESFEAFLDNYPKFVC